MKGVELLGCTLRDKVTKFQGVATGSVTYLTGCSQILLVPPVDNDGKLRDSQWFDEQRLELLPDFGMVVVDNSQFNGPDKEAPKR